MIEEEGACEKKQGKHAVEDEAFEIDLTASLNPHW